MKKNRIVAFIWISIVVLVIAFIVGYIIYAKINRPYMPKTNMEMLKFLFFINGGVNK